MDAPLTAKIVRVRQASLLNPLGQPTARKAIDFMVGEHGPFTVYLLDDVFTAAAAKAAVDAAAKEIIATLS